MYQLLDTNLFVGSVSDANLYKKDEWAVVHASRAVHYRIFGLNKLSDELRKKHPHYIIYENNKRLSFNWGKEVMHFDRKIIKQTFTQILDFIDKQINNSKVLVHCDLGLSRSPSLCLLYLAKRTDLISNNSYAEARVDFEKIYPHYKPTSIVKYLSCHWDNIE